MKIIASENVRTTLLFFPLAYDSTVPLPLGMAISGKDLSLVQPAKKERKKYEEKGSL